LFWLTTSYLRYSVGFIRQNGINIILEPSSLLINLRVSITVCVEGAEVVTQIFSRYTSTRLLDRASLKWLDNVYIRYTRKKHVSHFLIFILDSKKKKKLVIYDKQNVRKEFQRKIKQFYIFHLKFPRVILTLLILIFSDVLQEHEENQFNLSLSFILSSGLAEIYTNAIILSFRSTSFSCNTSYDIRRLRRRQNAKYFFCILHHIYETWSGLKGLTDRILILFVVNSIRSDENLLYNWRH